MVMTGSHLPIWPPQVEKHTLLARRMERSSGPRSIVHMLVEFHVCVSSWWVFLQNQPRSPFPPLVLDKILSRCSGRVERTCPGNEPFEKPAKETETNSKGSMRTGPLEIRHGQWLPEALRRRKEGRQEPSRWPWFELPLRKGTSFQSAAGRKPVSQGLNRVPPSLKGPGSQ